VIGYALLDFDDELGILQRLVRLPGLLGLPGSCLTWQGTGSACRPHGRTSASCSSCDMAGRLGTGTVVTGSPDEAPGPRYRLALCGTPRIRMSLPASYTA
jgi:hypothetical protein